jgi:hypothetical protein
MPGQRLLMRKIRDLPRLHAGGMSKRKVAASLLIGATAAGDCVRRARRAGLSWPLPENLSDEALERILYPPPKVTEGSATAARLGRNPSRTAPTWRDATAVVGGASQRLPRRLWLFELCWDRNYVARGRLALMGS